MEPQSSLFFLARSRATARLAQPKAVWAAPVALALISLAYFLRFVSGGDEGDLLSSVAFAITAVPFVLASLAAPGRLVHPLALFGFTMVLGVAGQTAFLNDPAGAGRTIRAESPAALLLSGYRPDILGGGLLVIAAGIAALVIGYVLPSSRHSPTVGRLLQRAVRHGFARPSPRRSAVAMTVLSAIALASFAVYAPKVGITTLDALVSSQKRFGLAEGQPIVFGYYRWGISFAGVAAIVGAFTVVQMGLRWRSYVGLATGVSFLLAVTFAVVVSSRTEAVTVAAIASLTVIAVRQREPRVASIIGVAVLVIGASILLLALRGIANEQYRSVGDEVSTRSLVAQVVGTGDWLDVGPVAVIVKRVPDDRPYAYGRTMVSVLWAPIPRSLWPEKPPVRIGPELGQQVFGYDPDRRSGNPPGVIGELWFNGGWLAVVVGMGIFGWLVRRVDYYYRITPATGGLAGLLYAVLTVAIALQLAIGDVTGALVFTLQYALVLTVVLWFVRSGPRRIS